MAHSVTFHFGHGTPIQLRSDDPVKLALMAASAQEFLHQRLGPAADTMNAYESDTAYHHAVKTHCSVCGKPTRLRCSVCKDRFYCGRDCQRSDRAIHKEHCTAPRTITG